MKVIINKWAVARAREDAGAGRAALAARVLWSAWRRLEREARAGVLLSATRHLREEPMSCNTPEVLAERPHMRIQRCGCGTLHVDLAHVTLRLEQGALERLHETVGEALAHLALEELRSSPMLRLVDEPEAAR